MYLLEHAYLIVLLPLLAGALILFFGKYLPMEGSWLGLMAIFYGLIHSILLVVGIYTGQVVLPVEGVGGNFYELSFDWFTAGYFNLSAGVMIDGMAAMMLLVVTLVSFLVQVYSLGYQHGKPRFGRYYAYLSLFTFSMLVLVIANNFLQFFIGWELVGLCSYLLIGFEFERPAAAYANRKAFITTKVGDLGFYLALFAIFTVTGTYNFSIIQAEHMTSFSPHMATAVALGLFWAACGKSAQVPLHVWLPDAMEGPTPVSALIHAATMVAAGVYLVARAHFLFDLSPVALNVVAWTGCLTALIAASTALVANDIKKVLAYSTISQLGYMMLSMGVGNVQAGMFHLTTHAFFKALLFLGAGSVIHAVHTNDIWQMGGLSKKMPVTFMTFACATLAIIGFPMFSGFFSKEEILGAVYAGHHDAIFVIAILTAFMTSFYMCRLFFLTFLGDPRDPHLFAHAHESGPSMTIPLSILAVLSTLAGFFFTYVWSFSRWVPALEEAAHHDMVVPVASLSAMLLGAGLAWAMYRIGSPDPAKLVERWKGVHAFLGRRVADEIYLWLIGKIYHPLSRVLARFDYEVLDQFIVDGFGWTARKISLGKKWFDDKVVDGFLVNGVGRMVQVLGTGLPLLQNGYVQFYLLLLAAGMGLIIFWAVKSFS